MRASAAVLVVALALPAVPAAAASAPAFRGGATYVPAKQRDAMTPSVWRPGCPVGFRDLRLVVVRHWDFRGRVRTGRLVVHRTVAREIVGVFRRLFEARFPIRRMRPIEAYRGSDFRSIEADNTSAFNCRFVDGTRRWSQHSYGRAIDVNPIENPYVSGAGRVAHRRSRPFVNRARVRVGMAVPGEALVEAFDAVGWGWGGRWSGAKDYQHFSTSGR